MDKESPPVPVLFNAEVALLLNKQKKNYQEKGIRVPEYVHTYIHTTVSGRRRRPEAHVVTQHTPHACTTASHRTLTLTLEYCKRFANVKGLEDEGASQYLTNLRQ